MEAHEEENLLHSFAVESEPYGNALSDDHSLLSVASPHALPDVVHEQPEMKDGGILDLGVEFPVALESPAPRIGQIVQRADRMQRVFVDRVPVIEIMLHEAGDAPELGNELAKVAKLMHEPKCRRNASLGA